MLRAFFLVLFPILFWFGCSSLPDSYPPPPQHQPLIVPTSSGLNYFLNMNNPNANAYLVEGIGSSTEGTGFRWVFDHAVVRFFVPRMDHPKFTMEFAIPERIFRKTGPMTLTFSINHKLLDRAIYAQSGQLAYEHEVPPELLNWDAINLISIQPDKVWTSPDGDKLGFVVSRLGFLE